MSSWVARHNPRGLRVAIIGAGTMGYWHGRTARLLDAKLVAIVDPDRTRAGALARRLRVKAATGDASALLQEGRVDAVHICSPSFTHAALTSHALESGVHALVEKPMAHSVEETRKLVDIARRQGVILCPVHQVAFQDGIADAAQALAGLGDLSVIDFRIYSAGGSGRTDRELDEIVEDILPHPLSVLRKLWPHAGLDPQHWFVSHPRPGELSVTGMHAGASLSILISLHARPTRFEMMASGPRGAVQLDFFHGFAVRHDGQVSRLRKASRPFIAALSLFGAATRNLLGRGLRGEVAYPGLRSLTRAFYAAARDERSPPISPEDIIAVAAARDAILIGSNRKALPFTTTRCSPEKNRRRDLARTGSQVFPGG